MRVRWEVVVVMILTATLVGTSAAAAKDAGEKHVDAGSFGVFMNGHRVGTETFTITQTGSGSVIQSEFKTEGSTPPAVQSSDLQLTPGGEIRRYEWKELSPGNAQSVVTPNEQFLTQKLTASPGDKPQEQPYLLPASTSVLDDYFFVHREILVWKFLGSSCKTEKGQLQCPLKERAQFGTMNPHQRTSAAVTMEFLGREKISIRGTEQDLLKVELKSEAGAWDIWLDDQFKVLRIWVPAEKTEVLRD